MASKFGEHADGSHLMARHLDFGYNLHMILGSILHQVAHLFLGVIALVGHQQVVLSPAHGSLLGELGIFFNLDAPSLVVDQMQVDGIELIAGHLGDKRLELVYRYERTGRVYHQLAYVSTGRILDGELRDGVNTFLVARAAQNLVESHQSPEHTAGSLTLDAHALRVDDHGVSLVIGKCRVDTEHEPYTALTAVHYIANTVAEHLASPLFLIVQSICIVISSCHHDVPCCMHIEGLRPLLDTQLLRHGDETLPRVTYLAGKPRLGIETAPASRLHISLLAALGHHELHAARHDAVERRHRSLGRRH